MSSLAQQSASRKDRLAQLRSLKRKHEGDGNTDSSNSSNESPVTIPDQDNNTMTEKTSQDRIVAALGRNFNPETRGPMLGYTANPLEKIIADPSGAPNQTVELVAEELQNNAIKKLFESINVNKELSLANLQPKRANWDLKRDLQPKMDLLDTKTDNQIVKLVRERIAKMKQADE
ncbi:hypothetical protein NADFUDRAFT_48795 [Nadsonia fulvescens var. elongata DSM 6958]|uniref:mRNA splicing factor n=1 Tax=Nadsonia fulvescens var. elongata DSM 6958 TaxID=857566 RepID=A0A1E3PSC4_9ASCO|nr:hypothetical protein NADFUDRAFT_48795 [Nadsonia fulvescens var. elongata DSM 6958]